MVITMHGSYLQNSSQSSNSSNQDSNVVPTLFSRVFSLKVFPFFTQSTLEGLKAELPLYLSKADGVSTEVVKLHCMVASTCE